MFHSFFFQWRFSSECFSPGRSIGSLKVKPFLFDDDLLLLLEIVKNFFWEESGNSQIDFKCLHILNQTKIFVFLFWRWMMVNIISVYTSFFIYLVWSFGRFSQFLLYFKWAMMNCAKQALLLFRNMKLHVEHMIVTVYMLILWEGNRWAHRLLLFSPETSIKAKIINIPVLQCVVACLLYCFLGNFISGKNCRGINFVREIFSSMTCKASRATQQGLESTPNFAYIHCMPV